MSEINFNRRVRERRNGRGGVLQIIDDSVAIGARLVHCAKVGIGIKHALLRLHSVVLDKRCGNSYPFIALHGTDLDLGIFGNLICNRLALARLYVHLVPEDINRPERPHPRLIAVHRSEIISLRRLQKIIYSFHFCSSLVITVKFTWKFFLIFATFLFLVPLWCLLSFDYSVFLLLFKFIIAIISKKRFLVIILHFRNRYEIVFTFLRQIFRISAPVKNGVLHYHIICFLRNP